jgi:hypothetical protein
LPNIDPRAAQQIQPELYSDETVYWAAMPDPHVIFHSDDWAVIPFSLLWCGFAVYWEANALGLWQTSRRSTGPDFFFIVWGIPFVVMGNYMVWGRFLHDAWLQRRTFYAVTNRRALIVRNDIFNEPNVHMIFIEAIPDVNREGAFRGTLWLGEKYPVLGSKGSKKRDLSRFALKDPVTFWDIDNVREVEHLISGLRAKTKASILKPILTYVEQEGRTRRE